MNGRSCASVRPQPHVDPAPRRRAERPVASAAAPPARRGAPAASRRPRRAPGRRRRRAALHHLDARVIFGAIPAFRSLDRGMEEGRDRETPAAAPRRRLSAARRPRRRHRRCTAAGRRSDDRRRRTGDRASAPTALGFSRPMARHVSVFTDQETAVAVTCLRETVDVSVRYQDAIDDIAGEPNS